MSGSEWPSKSQVERAGKRLRQILRGELDWAKAEECVEVLERHRKSHELPLNAASTAMRRFSQQLDLQTEVTQRLKKMTTIIDKLTQRESQMNMARMRDIAGTRVVVNDLRDLRLMERHIVQRRSSFGVSVIDYVEQPRSSGYRAVHLICDYGAEPRPVEIQLRTRMMHAWATAVEDVSKLVGVNHKQDGDTKFHDWARLYSRMLEAAEFGSRIQVSEDEWKAAWWAMFEERRSNNG